MPLTAIKAERFDDAPEEWPEAIRRELDANRDNHDVGQRIVSETERVRIWLISLAPGERLAFHRHVRPYFWTATSAGSSKSRYGDGRVLLYDYDVGETKHFDFSQANSSIHDLENVGTTTLSFTTVEFLDTSETA